jgi:hypothetical protein
MTDNAELIDPDEIARSLTGFEEIAIENMFRKAVHVLADDGTAMMRALLFVLEKRDGMADVDAFRKVMLMRLDDVVARFAQDDTTVPGEA